MKRVPKALLVFVPALTMAVPGWAQQHYNGFFLTSPLSLSSGYDDKFTTNTQVLDDSVSLLTTPTFAWLMSNHQTRLSVDYQAEFEMFAQHENLDAWNHAANFHFTQQITGRWSLDAADSFLSTMDPTRRLVNSLLLLPRVRYQENDFYARLRYRLDHRTVLNFRFDNGFTAAGLTGDVANRLDRVGFAETVTVDHTFTSRHAMSASYAYLYVHPLETGPSESNSSAHNVNVGYIYTANPGLIVRLFGGVTRANQSSFTGAAAVDKKVGRAWLSAGYQRYLAFFGSLAPVGTPIGPIPFAALSPNSIYQVVTLRSWGKLTNRVGLDANVQRALNGVTRDNRSIRSTVVQLRVDYKLNDRVTAFARTDFYGQNVSEFTTLPMSRRRYFGGLEIALSRAPELTDNPNRHKPLPPKEAEPEPGEERPGGNADDGKQQ